MFLNNTVRPPYDLVYLRLQDAPDPGHFVLNNVFRDNDYNTGVADSWAVSVALYADVDDSTSQHNYTIAGNVFDNPALPFEVAVKTGGCMSGHRLDLRYNYWGLPDMSPDAVEARLQDGIHQRGFCLADVSNFLLASPESTHASNNSQCITQPGHCGLPVANTPLKPLLDGSVLRGALLDTEFVVPAGTYRMTGNIIVGPDANLTFLAGAHITVEGDYHILVAAGGLTVDGAAGNPVVFQGMLTEHHQAGNFFACTAYDGSELNAADEYDNSITIERCTSRCADAGYTYAGMRNTRCTCGNEAGRFGLTNDCGYYKCRGDSEQICGGRNGYSVHYTGRASHWAGIAVASGASHVHIHELHLRDTGGVRSATNALRVDGPVSLQATGVRITSASSTAIHLTSPTAPRSAVSLENVYISEGHGHGIYVYDKACDTGCHFQNITILDKSHNGIYIDAANTESEDSTFENLHIEGCGFGHLGSTPDAHGFYVRDLRRRRLTIANSTILGNRRGIYTYYCSPWLLDNVVQNNGHRSGYYAAHIRYFHGGSLVVRGNTFDENYGHLHIDGNDYNSRAWVDISNNTFLSTRGGPTAVRVELNSRMLGATTLEGTEPQIRFSDNRILGGSYSQHAVHIQQSNVYGISADHGVLIANNLLDGVTAGGYLANMQLAAAWSVVVRNNILHNATSQAGAIRYQLQPEGAGRPSVHFNHLEQVRAPLMFRLVAADRQLPVNASFNFWGTKLYANIAAGIYDELDDPSLETVNFLPFLDASGEVVPFDPSDALRQPDGSLAGKLLTNLTFTAGSAYTLSGTLIVPSGITLRLEPNVILRLEEGTIVKVEGTLQADGNATQPVVVIPLAWGLSDEEARQQASAGTLGTSLAVNSTYLGCYQDQSTSELQGLETYSNDMTIDRCVVLCHDAGFIYAGLESGRFCRCDNSFGKYGKTGENECSASCYGNRDTKCGGYNENSMYRTGHPGGSWGAFTFDSQARPSTLTTEGAIAGGSYLRHIYFAGGGLPLGSRGSTVVVSSDNVAMHHVTIRGAAGTCIAFNRDDSAAVPLRLMDVALEKCVGNGLYFHGGMFAAGADIAAVQMKSIGYRGIYADAAGARSVAGGMRISNVHMLDTAIHASLFRASVPAIYFRDLYISSPVTMTDISIRNHATSHAIEMYRTPTRIENAVFDNVGSARDHYCVYLENMEQSSPPGGMVNGTCRHSRSGVYARQEYNDDRGFVLTDSVFEDLAGDYALRYHPYRIAGGIDAPPELALTNNQVLRGSFRYSIFDIAIPCCGDTEYLITGNHITNATSTGGHVVRLDKVASTSIDVRFEHNVLRGNTASNGLMLSGGTTSGERRPEVHYNVFANPALAGHELRVTVTDANRPVNATLNFWDTDVEFIILQEKVYDISDDTSLERVLIFPYLVSADAADVIDLDAERAAFVGPNGEVQGVVETDAILSLADAPLPGGAWPVVGHLVVASGTTLEVEPGVTLILEPGVTINVKGTLLTEGRPEAIVSLTCNASTAVPRGQYHGCRGDLNNNDFSNFLDYSSMTVDACLEFCGHHGHTFAAIEFRSCMCLNGDEGSVVSDSNCRRACQGMFDTEPIGHRRPAAIVCFVCLVMMVLFCCAHLANQEATLNSVLISAESPRR
jgi:hypothetical protein